MSASLLIDIAQKHGRFTPLPRIPDSRLPVAGDTVTVRGGYTATVLGVEIDHKDFDEPKFYLSNGRKVTRYAITGVMSERIAA